MKAGYRAIERVLAAPADAPLPRPPRRLRAETLRLAGACCERRDPVPSVLELQERSAAGAC